MSREMCYRCFWPRPLCWCSSITAMSTKTRFVILMHPKEAKRIKAGTGRFTHLCLADSEIHTGVEFGGDAVVQTIISDPANYPVLLYPGSEAVNLSRDGFPSGIIGTRRLVVFVLDATWRLARTMFNHNEWLRTLPRLMFTPSFKSRYVIKKQPNEWCLSTLEAVHELLLLLDRAGMDTYANPSQMVDLFDRMQRFQIDCENDPLRQGGYRRRKFSRHLPEGGRESAPFSSAVDAASPAGGVDSGRFFGANR